ncbi:MAG: hypothetical protein KGV57_01810 [Fusobacterium sp.]|nr:hypothetical protein [Fusobacterium sp.]
MKIMDIVLFTLEYKTLFLSIYFVIVILQIFLLLKKATLQRTIVFILHKIIVFYAIGFLLLYLKNLDGFFIYLFGVVILGFSMRITEKILKGSPISIIDFLLIGDINLTLFFVIILFGVIKGIS